MPERGVFQPYPPGPPDHGTHPWGELEGPRGIALLVFAPADNGTAAITAFGPVNMTVMSSGDWDAVEAAMNELLDQARAHARRIGGVVVKLGALADFREVPRA